MILVDTHAHLYWDCFKEDFDQVIARALGAGVNTIINVGVDIEKSAIATKLESDKVKFYSTIGIHPHEAVKPEGLAEIEELEGIYRSNPKKVIAIGECGLDYLDADEQTKQLQKKLFQAQIDLAKKLNLPLIVHCRNAWEDTIKETADYFGIYHCYSGQPETTEKVLETRFLISFAGNLTYPKNDYLREAAKKIPLNRIVLETDCPFLPPQSKRGQRDEPAYIVETAKLLAEIKGLSLEEIARQTTENVKIMFKL